VVVPEFGGGATAVLEGFGKVHIVVSEADAVCEPGPVFIVNAETEGEPVYAGSAPVRPTRRIPFPDRIRPLALIASRAPRAATTWQGTAARPPPQRSRGVS
jgi:hypothetical protein